MSGRTYLDYTATAPVRPEVVEGMAEALARWANPSSVHASGRAARAAMEKARGEIALALGGEPENLVFTSGGTEANALALAQAASVGSGGRIAVSAIEHPSVLEVNEAAHRLPVGPDGALDLDAAREAIARLRPALVSVMLANNETGVIQPVRELVPWCREAGALLHLDAVQAFGKIPVRLADLGADLLSVSAHKIGGPPGIGALLARPGLELAPLLKGGGQEGRRRAGTESLPAVVGFAIAVGRLDPLLPDRLRAWRDGLEARLEALLPDLVVIGRQQPRLANTSCIARPGLRADLQLMALDLQGVMVSAGSACSSGRIGPSPTLVAMGMAPGLAAGAIRVSLGWATRAADLDRFLEVYQGIGGTGGRL